MKLCLKHWRGLSVCKFRMKNGRNVRTGRREANFVLVVKRIDERTLVVIEAFRGHIIHTTNVDQNRQCG